MKEVIILAGGVGSRLKSVIDNMPKCMAEVNQRPFISYILDSLLKYSYNRFIFSLGYLSEDVIKYIKVAYPNIDAVFSIETEPLFTGGAIRLAIEYVESDSVLILNADTFFGLDLDFFFKTHVGRNMDVTLALKPMFNYDRYGSVKFDPQYNVQSFEEKTKCDFGYINCGYVYLRKEVFTKYLVNRPFSFEEDFMKEHLGKIRIGAFVDDSYFVDIGIPEDYQKVKLDYPKLI